MAKFNVLHCPVCGSENFSPFLKCIDHFVSGEEFQIKKCSSCGFKITEEIEDEENIGSYYQSDEYISHSNTSKGLVNSVYHRVRKYMLGQKRKLVEKISPEQKGSILDIGTGTGFFLNEMKQHGWQTTGTEKSTEARQFVKSEFNLDVFPTEQLFGFKENKFDVVTLWHVLEHIHQLDANMETFHKILKAKGKLIIAVPNNSSYDAEHYREYWAAYDVPRHIWHFTPEQMESFGKRFGFKLTEVHAMPFDSFYVSLLSEKYKKSKLALVKGIIHGTVSWFASSFKPGRCSSVIYVFGK
ncbi:class I SAM-dependent methyltransferase [Maribellus comscasis]|uniref:class I SAM-dependent methyltransferase n=1 Tax=Maribellus comscasis TaxID=2681766 RepID=UPI001C2D3CB1|nr:class I SAM-dependent methyltransferase [Maribellus comscasis]